MICFVIKKKQLKTTYIENTCSCAKENVSEV